MTTHEKLNDCIFSIWASQFYSFAFALVVGVAIAWTNGASARAGEFPAGFFANSRALPGNINRPRSEFTDARISPDGLKLYVTRVSPDGIYVAERNSPDGEFGDPVRLGGSVNRSTWAGMGSVTQDELGIYYYRDSPAATNGCCGTLFTATRENDDEEFGNPVELKEINSIRLLACSREELCFDEAPYISPNGLELYFASFRVGNHMDLYKSTRADTSESFVDVTPLTELNSRFDDIGPTLSSDGLTLFFSGSTGWRYIPADRTPGTREGGIGKSDIWAATRPSLDAPFDNVINLGPGVNSVQGEEMPAVSADWPSPGSEIYFSRLVEAAQGSGFSNVRGQMQIWQATWYVPNGADLDGNGQLDITDVDLLHTAVRDHWTNDAFDLDQSGTVDFGDLRHMMTSELVTYFGDANLDGEFNSSDLTTVFQAAKYELDEDAGWAEGDWTGDGRFDSSDLAAAFQDGGFEKGPRTAVAAIPEPSGWIVLSVGLTGISRIRRKH